ncbi:MAG: tyrosine--tRNA ligase [Chloroflexi bacterium]|nr:tyrosine--tRNA ligase [Chloroflexota bacterium]
MSGVFETLQERGFVEQVSDEAGLRQALQQPIAFYNGYDPTAASFHVGNLLTIMALAHMQRGGHRPIALVGSGTCLIGDPTGRSEMRKMMTLEHINANGEKLKLQLQRFLDFSDGQAIMVNNADWLLELRYLEFLRDIGRHFSVNRMLASETYRVRYAKNSLSFLEFNYQLLQAYDFLYLYRKYGCKLQTGGNDQWGNILAGVDLVRRVDGAEVYAMTYPLLTTASGAKMGKSAQGAVWLDAEMFSPYDFYQFWINVADADVERLFKIYTFMPLDEIRQLASLQGAEIRQAKQVLAFAVTELVHGKAEAEKARAASQALFANGIEANAVPSSDVAMDELAAGIPLPKLYQLAGLAKSASEARRLIEQGGAYLNDEQVSDVGLIVTQAYLKEGALLLRAGKKRYHRLVAG